VQNAQTRGNMKKVFFLTFIAILGLSLNAEIMTIQMNSGETIEFDTAEILQITFGPDVSVEEVVEFISKIPIKFLQNYPNPFNPTTTISFEIAEAGKTQIEIYNVKGQKIKTLLDETMEIGGHSTIWNGTDSDDKQVASGIYFYKVSVNNTEQIKKMILIK